MCRIIVVFLAIVEQRVGCVENACMANYAVKAPQNKIK